MDFNRLVQVLREATTPERRESVVRKRSAHLSVLRIHPDDERIEAPVERFLQSARDGSNGVQFMGFDSAGYMGFIDRHVASHLCNLVENGKSPEQAVEALKAALEVRDADAIAQLVVHGPIVESKIELGAGVSIVPLAHLPASAHSDRLNEAIERQFFPTEFANGPHAALIAPFTVERPLLLSSDANLPRQDTVEVADQLMSACYLLSAVGPLAIQHKDFWMTYVDPDLRGFCGETASVGVVDLIRPSTQARTTALTKDGTEWIARVLGAAKSDKWRRGIVRASRRLSRAMLQMPYDDAVPDLAIAIEAVGLIDNPGEVTHKLGVRAARLIARDIDERLQIRSTLRRFYGVRSAIMHGGDSGGSKDAQEVAEIVARLIRSMAAFGRIPDHDRLDLE